MTIGFLILAALSHGMFPPTLAWSICLCLLAMWSAVLVIAAARDEAYMDWFDRFDFEKED